MNAVRRHQSFSSNEHHEPGLRARGAREDSLFYPSLSLILFLTRREINPRVHARARSHPVGVQSRHREARRLTRIAAPFDGPGLGPWRPSRDIRALDLNANLRSSWFQPRGRRPSQTGSRRPIAPTNPSVASQRCSPGVLRRPSTGLRGPRQPSIRIFA